MTTGKNLGALNLLAEGLLRILQVKQNTDIADVDKALDLLNGTNPELIGWLHKRLLSCIARNISKGSAPIADKTGKTYVRVPVNCILDGPEVWQCAVRGCTSCTQRMINRDREARAVAGGSATARPDAGSQDDYAMHLSMMLDHQTTLLENHMRFTQKVIDEQRKIADGIRKLVS